MSKRKRKKAGRTPLGLDHLMTVREVHGCTPGEPFIELAGPMALTELMRTMEAHRENDGPGAWMRGTDEDDSWTYGDGGSRSKYLEQCRVGNLPALDEAEKLSKRVEKEIDLGQVMPQVVPSVAGGGLSVPAALGGNPYCFQTNIWRKDGTSPLRIIFDVGASCGVSNETLHKRGVAALALAKAVSTVRPVRLEAFAAFKIDGQNCYSRMPLGTSPLDWPMAATVLGTSSYMRDTCFRLARWVTGQYHDSGNCGVYWGDGYSGHGGDFKAQKDHPILRKVLGLGGEDLMFDHGYLTDKLLTKDPFAWIQAQVKTYNLNAAEVIA